ncbi:hypothetical protein DMB42_44700 [Nonomuraea sp. WAC 01424]|nr:hypothetical protein DMB42_44700 [Nonomuraea sp. WAC 01424]
MSDPGQLVGLAEVLQRVDLLDDRRAAPRMVRAGATPVTRFSLAGEHPGRHDAARIRLDAETAVAGAGHLPLLRVSMMPGSGRWRRPSGWC